MSFCSQPVHRHKWPFQQSLARKKKEVRIDEWNTFKINVHHILIHTPSFFETVNKPEC